MRSQDGTVSKKKFSTAPFVTLALSMLVFTMIVFSLLISISSLKRDNERLSKQVSTLLEEGRADRAAMDSYKQQAEALQAAIQDNKALADAVPALQGDMAALAASSANPGFTVDSFNLNFFSDTDYKYQSYTGAGTVRTGNTKDSYLVLLKKTLKSGGAPTTKPVEYLPILVVGGTGSFTTDDSAEGTLVKPEYGFDIVGYIRIVANG